MKQISLNQISKRFNRNYIFESISTDVKTGEILIITGKNGSGKSTLIKIIAGLLGSSGGSIEYQTNGRSVSVKDLKGISGFVAPYFNLFNQITAFENIDIFNRSLKKPLNKQLLLSLFETYQLSNKANYKLRQYSSGMKQRLRLLVATMHKPDFLLMDEPSSNLDIQGKELVRDLISQQSKRGPIIICTNEAEEVKWGTKVIEL